MQLKPDWRPEYSPAHSASPVAARCGRVWFIVLVIALGAREATIRPELAWELGGGGKAREPDSTFGAGRSRSRDLGAALFA